MRSPLWHALRLTYQCDKKTFLIKIVYIILLNLLPLVNLYVLKYLIDGISTAVADGSTLIGQTILICVAIYCLVYLATRLINVLNSVNNDILTQKLIDYINGIIQHQSARLDMEYYDNPDYHDTFHRAQQEAAYRPVRILESFVTVMGAVVTLVGIFAILCTTSWKIIAVMIVAVLPTFFVRLYKSRSIYKFRKETTQQMRRGQYYGQLLTNRTFAQEVRAFGLAGYFRHLYVSVRKTLVRMLLRISRRLAVYDTLTAIVETAALFFLLIILIKPVFAGIVTIGTFVMLFEALRRGQHQMQTLVGGVSSMYEHKLFIGNLTEFLALEPKITSPSHPIPFPKEIDSVEFSHVTFAYTSSDKTQAIQAPVLRDFCFEAHKGSIAHLQGENGYGKSTALKLLLRLYDPQQGSIRINGIDIREFDLKALRSGISAIFQDPVRFYFTAKENVEFGDIQHTDDSARMQRALELSEAQSIVDRLPNGADTLLGRMFEHGEELSLGQWQRLALARQLYGNAPILFFDEPTAWMDAAARTSFFSHLEQLKQEHIVILISHSENLS